MTSIEIQWGVFALIIIALLAIDFCVLNKQGNHRVSIKEAITWSLIWLGCALAFNIGLWAYFSHTSGTAIANEKALLFLTGYLIEKSLSIDNLFVFIMVFTAFKIPAEYQRRILLYGVLGAIVFRVVLILAGVWLVNEFHWILYIFGAFLVFMGVKMFQAPQREKASDNSILTWLQTHLRVTKDLHGDKFMIRQNGLYYATPLLIVLLFIEISDIIFAVDSIPAIFSITTDPFMVITSNIFAILGLRSLYFVLAAMAERFYFLKYGIAVILIFVGIKLLITPWVTMPIIVSLAVILGVLGISMLWRQR